MKKFLLCLALILGLAFGASGALSEQFDVQAFFNTGSNMTTKAPDDRKYWERKSVTADVFVNSDGTLSVTETWNISVHNMEASPQELSGSDFPRRSKINMGGFYQTKCYGTMCFPDFYEIDNERFAVDNAAEKDKNSFIKSPGIGPGTHSFVIKYDVLSAVKYVAGGRVILRLDLFKDTGAPAEIYVHLAKDPASGLYRPGDGMELITGPADSCLIDFELDPSAFEAGALCVISEEALNVDPAAVQNDCTLESLDIDAEVTAAGDVVLHETMILDVAADGFMDRFDYSTALASDSDASNSYIDVNSVKINGTACRWVEQYGTPLSVDDPEMYSGVGYYFYQSGVIRLTGIIKGSITIDVDYTIKDAVRLQGEKPYMHVDLLNGKRAKCALINAELRFPEGSGATVEYDGWPKHTKKGKLTDGLTRVLSDPVESRAASSDTYMLLSFRDPSVFSGLKKLYWNKKTLLEWKHAIDWEELFDRYKEVVYFFLAICGMIFMICVFIRHPEYLQNYSSSSNSSSSRSHSSRSSSSRSRSSGSRYSSSRSSGSRSSGFGGGRSGGGGSRGSGFGGGGGRGR